MFEAGLTALGVSAAVGWFLWQRFQALEKRLDRIELSALEQKHKLETSRLAGQSNIDRLELFCNGNKELIEHRTQRFKAEMEKVEVRLSADVSDIKAFLSQNSDFGIRGRSPK